MDVNDNAEILTPFYMPPANQPNSRATSNTIPASNNSQPTPWRNNRPLLIATVSIPIIGVDSCSEGTTYAKAARYRRSTSGQLITL